MLTDTVRITIYDNTQQDANDKNTFFLSSSGYFQYERTASSSRHHLLCHAPNPDTSSNMVRNPLSLTFCSSSVLSCSRILPSNGEEYATYNRTQHILHCFYYFTLKTGVSYSAVIREVKRKSKILINALNTDLPQTTQVQRMFLVM